MKSLIKVERSAFRRSAIFKIPIESEQHVFMRVDDSNGDNDKRCVVLVNAHDFLASWARDPYNFEAKLSRGSRQDWINDYKYPKAELGFSKGQNDPVPLAKVVCRHHKTFEPTYAPFLVLFKKRVGYQDKHFSYSGFINGITRTIWLLANGAHYFPIECNSKEGAKLLYECCAYENERTCTVEELVK